VTKQKEEFGGEWTRKDVLVNAGRRRLPLKIGLPSSGKSGRKGAGVVG